MTSICRVYDLILFKAYLRIPLYVRLYAHGTVNVYLQNWLIIATQGFPFYSDPLFSRVFHVCVYAT